MRSALIVAGFALGAVLLGQGSYMQAKAWLAQILIAHSWTERGPTQAAAKPWPWADTYVVAKLTFPRQQQVRYVMSSASGESLAFGPGHMSPTVLPAGEGHSMVAGHRDSHFANLEHTALGDIIEAESLVGVKARYRVIDVSIIDTRESQLELSDGNLLSLITCYPFNSLTPGGPLRMVVTAEKLAAKRATEQRGETPPKASKLERRNQTKPDEST